MLLHLQAVLCLGFNFIDAALVAATFKFGVEPDANNLECECFGDRACADCDAVCIVVLLGQLGRPLVPAEAAAHTFNLVGNNRFAVSAAAQNDAVIGLAVGNCLSRWANEIWIIAGFVAVAAAIDDGVTTVFQEIDDWVFKGKARVVGADGNGEGWITHESD